MTPAHVAYRFWLMLLIQTCVASKITASPDEIDLLLKDTGKKIENRIEIQISKADYFNVKNVTGSKFYLKKPVVVINQDTIQVKDIHTRGQTTLYLRRKSFSFDLKSKATVYHGEQKESMKKFNAISLSMDKNYIRNRLAFELMEKLQLFDLFYSFSEVRINGQSEGIYMIIERPEDWALKKKNSPLIIRRGFDHKIDKIKTGKKIDKPDQKHFRNYYSEIYRSLNKYEGGELYDVLSKWIDLEMYMKWLAFNFFVRNGDYTDEVYLCIDPKENRFKIIPWDYDDIFAIAPHEGMDEKKKTIGDKYLFSSEDQLDKKIANDSYLYNLYLNLFKEVLLQLSENILKQTIEHTYADLYPYFANQEIIGMSQYDSNKNADLNTLKNDLTIIFQQLILSRQAYLGILK